MEHSLQTIYDNVSIADTLSMYFIIRKEKANITGRRRVLDRYDFSTLRVDINEEISLFLKDLAQKQIENAIKKELELTPYEVISDDQEQVFTYAELNKIGSFAKVINEQLPHKFSIPTMQNFDEILKEEELLWAYCIELSYVENNSRKYIYTFRKLNAGNIVVDEKENRAGKIKNIMTLFNTRSNKLEKFKGGAIKLDATIDCIFDTRIFYILQKSQFETLVGMATDFQEQAISVVEDLQKLDMIDGLEHISDAIAKNTAIHKKLVRLKKLQNYRNLNADMIAKMKRAAKTEKYKLKTNAEGKIVIEDTKDVDMVIKLLCDYYKQGVVTGKNYGTYAGKSFDTPVNQ